VTVAIRLDTLHVGQAWAGSLSASDAAPNNSLVSDSLESEYKRITALMISSEDVPTEGAVTSASRFLPTIFDRSMRLRSWTSPHISVSESGELVFEWWSDTKKITFYFGDGSPEYLKVWGTDIETEMDSGILTDGWCLTSILLWLYS
jgi:hypothetical protein